MKENSKCKECGYEGTVCNNDFCEVCINIFDDGVCIGCKKCIEVVSDE